MKEDNNFIAVGIPPIIAYKELTLNLENQGYKEAAIISKYILYPITLLLIKWNII